MTIEIRPVRGKKELKTFIYLPEKKYYKDCPQWVPPFYDDEPGFYNPAKNPAYNYSDAEIFLAWDGDEAVGRIMVIDQHRMNERFKMKNARFSLLESPENKEVACALLKTVEDWAKDRGLETISGPHGFSDQDPEGMLIMGFEHRATIASYYNFPYLPKLVEECGYVKDFDYRVFEVQLPKEPPPLYIKIAERLHRQGFCITNFTKKKEIYPHLANYVKIQNMTFSEIYGFVPLAQDEGEKLIKEYLRIIDPHFVKFLYKIPKEEIGREIDPNQDEIVGFIAGVPDITEGIQKAKGRILPFGIFKILAARKNTDQLDLLMAGIKEKYRNRGLSALFAVNIINDANKLGYDHIDTHTELEFNKNVHSEWDRFESREYKRVRVFKKELIPGGFERNPRPHDEIHDAEEFIAKA